MNKLIILALATAVSVCVSAVPVDGPVLTKVTDISVSYVQITTTNGGALVATAPYAWRDSHGAVVPGHIGLLVLTEPMLSDMLSLDFPTAKAAVLQLLAASANNTLTLQLSGSVISAFIFVRQTRADGGQFAGTITWPDITALGLPSAQILVGIQSSAQAAVSAK